MTEMATNESGSVESGQYPEAQPVTLTPAPGAQLAGRREQAGMTVEQVANQLNLAPRQIQALEADNYGALPGLASVRGFIRAYAKLLKMDAEPLVQAIAHEAIAAKVEPLGPALSTTPFSDGRSALAGRRFPLKWMIALAVLAGLIAVIAVGQQMGWLAAASSTIEQGMASFSSAEPETAASVPAGTAETAHEKTANGGSTVTSEVPAIVTVPARVEMPPVAAKPVEPAPAAKPAAQAAVAPAPAVAAAPAAVAPVAPAPAATPVKQVAANPAPAASPAPATASVADSKDLLVLKVKADSWIDIRRRDNSALVSRLARAGETEAVKVSGPLALTVGNAAGVEATLRGKTVPLQTEARSNVARLTLK
jgi:cytoskeleton protein RodZ